MVALLALLAIVATPRAPTASAAEEQSWVNHCYYNSSGSVCTDIIGNYYHTNCSPPASDGESGVKSLWWALTNCQGGSEN